jgi:hypothetical protein
MSNHYYTAAQLIAAAKSYIAEDAAIMSRRPAGRPRAAWRRENSVSAPPSFGARDTAYKTTPCRRLSFTNGNPYDLWVWSAGRRPRVVERIDLSLDDADARLARYVCCQ